MVSQKFTLNRPKKENDDNSAGRCTRPNNFFHRLMLRKSIDQLQAEANQQNELKRTLGWFQLLGLGIGSIIG